VHRHAPGSDDAVNRLLHPQMRQSLPGDEIARLADAVALSAHDAFLVAALIAAGTLVLVLAFPRGLSPTQAGH